ncbi:hypothetical protein Tsubulata_018696 [Turnera subulata]|uniref:RING-type E3 ubiquitin transferase n=1 Tax=Turnera subulata TaxID=218843 RepID=A0A9Q0G0N1_9ROSI|nr:hypothetical protein Tsubulata_018696 [Turnera subulata]
MDGDEDHRQFRLSALTLCLLGIIAGSFVVTIYHCIRGCLYQRQILRPVLNEQDQARSSSSPNIPIGGGEPNANANANARRMMMMMISIPQVVYSKEFNEGMCSVCLCDFREGQRIRVLPDCAHLFHVGCIDAWLKARPSCPLCRADIMAPPHLVLSLPDMGGIRPRE